MNRTSFYQIIANITTRNLGHIIGHHNTELRTLGHIIGQNAGRDHRQTNIYNINKTLALLQTTEGTNIYTDNIRQKNKDKQNKNTTQHRKK